MGQDDGHGARSSRPWLADALDPMENLRALADVQAFGRRAAEDLADRILAWGDGQDGSAPGAAPEAGAPQGGPALADIVEQLRGDAVLAGEVSTRLVEHAVSLVGILIERLPPRSRTDAAPPQVDLPSVVAGGESSAVFWVHNTSAAVVAAVRPHCAPPRSHLGRELAPDAVAFDPPILDPLPARSTCGIEVCVRVAPDVEPGLYVSVLMASNVPDLYLPLQVTVDYDGPPE